jgi:hypothetical protein
MSRERRICPMAGCPDAVSKGKLLCRRHWWTVPEELCRAAHRGWRSCRAALYKRDLPLAERLAAVEAYREASGRAIGAAGTAAS